jgi:hypothetical protein
MAAVNNCQQASWKKVMKKLWALIKQLFIFIPPPPFRLQALYTVETGMQYNFDWAVGYLDF